MKEIISYIFGFICGGVAVGIGAHVIGSFREENRRLNDRIKKMENEFRRKDGRISQLERDLLNLRQGGDVF